MNLWQLARNRTETRDAWGTGYTLSDYISWIVGGNQYYGVQQTLQGKYEPIENNFEGIVAGAYKRDGVVFAVELARLMVFSEARFQYQRMTGGRPGDLWGDQSLSILEHPWTNATTGDLLTKMLVDADLAGNAYLTKSVQTGGRIRRLRPDWVNIVLGSHEDVDNPQEALDCEVVGYLYRPMQTGGRERFLPADEVAHFAPVPDPIANFRGMSWITPVIREIQADKGATEHKAKFFENGATPNLAVKFDPTVTKKQIEEFSELFDDEHKGVANAYKTLFLGGGADVTVVGANMQQLEFKQTQGAGETRIAAAGGVPAVIVGLSEGLQAATYSNFGQARRAFADRTLRPLWRNAAGSLETLVPAPQGNRLWYDDRDIAFLRDDTKDAAEIQSTMAGTVNTLVAAGYKPDEVIDAVMAGDLARLKGHHTGLFSVQLQPPGTKTTVDAQSGSSAA